MGSTKSYDYVREHVNATSTVDFVPARDPITASYEEGSNTTVSLHDGSGLNLHKLAPDWDPEDRFSAINALQRARASGEILTGLLYVNTEFEDLHGVLNTNATPLNKMGEKELCPGSKILSDINKSFS